ncbi:alpha/beta hydrolase [Anaerosphaera multitolerans]|uniref:Alpha/beta hydrolase n=1 Tax=Anaerosphaera multitolerans TaxID=2487351 RepID=A0A437S5F7_9FIRM|nr:alpha/beta hydrolase [Anaerosphaera multitolerans]RVU54234.1 alpha/beta hydrolase [Anaerosphaera multitolerans]
MRKILKISLTLIILLLLFLTLLPFIVMPSLLNKRFEQVQYNPDDFKLDYEQISLNTTDNLNLAAWHTYSENTKGTVIILSGINNPSVTQFFGYSKMLNENGWDCLLIEMRARSQSEGNGIGLGMTEWKDVVAGVDYLKLNNKASSLPIIVMGTSMGASTSIIAAGEDNRINGVIAISPYSDFPSVFIDTMKQYYIPKPIRLMEKPFITMYLGLHYGFNNLNYNSYNALNKFNNRPLLLMHSKRDRQVDFYNFIRLKSKSNQLNMNTTTFTREGYEHFFIKRDLVLTPKEDPEFCSIILNFLNNNF